MTQAHYLYLAFIYPGRSQYLVCRDTPVVPLHHPEPCVSLAQTVRGEGRAGRPLYHQHRLSLQLEGWKNTLPPAGRCREPSEDSGPTSPTPRSPPRSLSWPPSSCVSVPARQARMALPVAWRCFAALRTSLQRGWLSLLGVSRCPEPHHPWRWVRLPAGTEGFTSHPCPSPLSATWCSASCLGPWMPCSLAKLFSSVFWGGLG